MWKGTFVDNLSDEQLQDMKVCEVTEGVIVVRNAMRGLHGIDPSMFFEKMNEVPELPLKPADESGERLYERLWVPKLDGEGALEEEIPPMMIPGDSEMLEMPRQNSSASAGQGIPGYGVPLTRDKVCFCFLFLWSVLHTL